MILLTLMSELLPSTHLIVAHFDHKTRGEESTKDAQFVARVASQKGLMCVLGSRKGEKTSENSLRRERKQFLEEVCERYQCDYVVLAHHLQDQFETFLMRLLRGTGLDGLAVMEPRKGIWLRPLLDVSRESIEREAKLRGVVYRVDSSNLVPANLRNEIRLELMPKLEILSERYGGKEKWLQRLSPLFLELRTAKYESHQKINKKLGSMLVCTDYWARISRSDLESFSEAERRRVVRVIVSRLGIETLSSKEVGRIEEALREKKKKCSVTGLEMVESCGFIYFSKQGFRGTKVRLDYQSDRGVTICQPLGFRAKTTIDPGRFEWRQVMPGDRFRGKKIKDYFLEKRVPSCERSLVPLLAKKESNEVEWVFPERHPFVQIECLSFPFAIKT